MATEIPFEPVKPTRGGKPLDAFYNKLAANPAWVCQAKLNGRRAVWDGDGVLWSRQANDINSIAPSVVEALANVDAEIDGEYIRTVGTHDGVFYPFDLPGFDGTQEERWAALEEIVDQVNSSAVVLCPAEVTWTDVALHGWEGVVFKKRSSYYRRGLVPDKTVGTWVKYRAEWL